MRRIQAVNYVISTARYSEEAPLNESYFVRYPTAYGGKVFFSGDVLDLTDKVFAFGRTKQGRDMWNSHYAPDDYMTSKEDE